jgi:hypothetical protein
MELFDEDRNLSIDAKYDLIKKLIKYTQDMKEHRFFRNLQDHHEAPEWLKLNNLDDPNHKDYIGKTFEQWYKIKKEQDSNGIISKCKINLKRALPMGLTVTIIIGNILYELMLHNTNFDEHISI